MSTVTLAATAAESPAIMASPTHARSRSHSGSRSPSSTRNSHLLTAYSEFQPLSAHDLAVLDHYQADAADLLAVRSHLVALDTQVRTLRSQVLVLIDADLAKYHAAATRIQAAWRGARGREAVRQSGIKVPVRAPAEVGTGKSQARPPPPAASACDNDPGARAAVAALAARLAPIESGFADLAATVDQLASQLSAFIASSSSPRTDQPPPRSPTAASFRSVTPRPSPPVGELQEERVSKQDLDWLHRQVMDQESQVEKLREALAKVMADNARMRGVVKSAAARTIQVKWKSTRSKPTLGPLGPHTPPPAPAASSHVSTTSSATHGPHVVADLTLDSTPLTPPPPKFGAPVSPSPIRPRIRQPIFDPQTPTTGAGDTSMLSEAEESFLDQVARKTARRGSSTAGAKRPNVMISPPNVMSGIDSGSEDGGGRFEDEDAEAKWVSVDDFNYMRAEVELLRAELDRVVALVGRTPVPVVTGAAGEDTTRLDAMESGNSSLVGGGHAVHYVAQPHPHPVSVATVLRSSVSLPGSEDVSAGTPQSPTAAAHAAHLQPGPVGVPASAPPQVSGVPTGATLVGPVAFYDF